MSFLSSLEKLQYRNGDQKQKTFVDPFIGTLAFDNDPSTCSLTTLTEDPWLRLYAHHSVYVRAVAITNSVQNPSYLQNAVVKVGNHDPEFYNANSKCYGPVPNIQSGKTVAFPCSIPYYGKYVTVHLYGSRTLSICELAVYGDRYVGKRTVVIK